jgi:hypothetical protein
MLSMTGKKVAEPRSAVESPTLEAILERVTLARRLVMLSLDFSAKARANAELAQAGLAELDTMLAAAAQKRGAT